MKKLIISGLFCSVLMLGGFQVASAEETTTTSTSNSAMLAKIQDLMKMIADLQAKLAEVRGEVQELTKDLALGASDEDVKKAQEILASDPALFGVKPTGYFGPLTESAVKKFQERYGLPVTGVLDEATREVMKELRAERKDGRVPDGLVKSDEVKDRIKARLQDKWGDCVWGEKFRAADCKKGHDDKDKEDKDGEGKKDKDDKEGSGDDDEDAEKVTRDDARRAVVNAQNALNTLRDDIDEMEEDDEDEDVIDEAEDVLKDAQKKMVEARRAFAKNDFNKAADASEDVIDIIEGEDEDDEDDDEDEDEDEDDE